MIAACLAVGHGAQAHPMGNFSISHYARFQPDGRTLQVRYILDMAEIPTVTEKQALDANHDGVISPPEKAAYLAAQERQLRAGVTLAVNGRPVPLHLQDSDLRLSPGAGGLETLKIFLDWQAPLPPARLAPVVTWTDRNDPDRTGWKEVVTVAGAGDALRDSSASALDRSQGLSLYPRDIIPPQDTQARFTVVPGSLTPRVAAASTQTPPTRDATPRDAFTQVIARHALTPGIMLAGLLIAFIFGAFHALSPGHGKTMVAAYLVGSRGTPRHAVALGIIVTVTHTLGVFLLGFITLFAARDIVPEKLYPVLSVVSGLSVFGVGLWLLVSRLRGLPDGHTHEHEHDHTHAHEHVHDHEHGPDEIHLHTHDHDHDHRHTHEHDHGHSHGFGHHHHHHVPEGPITARALVALGVSGGIVPCPSALVVLLSAIALHRVAYGLLLISAFSVGLASVLVAIGLLVVSARRLADRFPSSGPLLQRLPLASAAAITLIGLMLVVRAFAPGGF